MEYLLFEHIRGCELFTLKEFEDLASSSYNDYLSLTQVVTHVSSLPFDGPEDALDYLLQKDSAVTVLRNFLEINNVKILHCDASLSDILSHFGIVCRYSPNITRGIRHNIHRFLRVGEKENACHEEMAATPSNCENTTIPWLKQMTISTSHAFSREAIQYDMGREDNLVTAVAAELDALEDEMNVLRGRVQQMVEWIFPQFMNVCPRSMAAQSIEWVLDPKLPRDKASNGPGEEFLTEALEDVDAKDLESLRQLYDMLREKRTLFEELEKYLEEKMQIVAPNLRCILGDRLACKFIRQSGSLVNLSLLPASTIQLIGAEKSLFRSLKTRTPTPKFGIIHALDNVKEHHGRMARYIATKCALAARIDAFGEDRSSSYGQELKKLIDKKIRSYRNGPKPATTKSVLERVKDQIDLENKKSSSLDRMKPKGSANTSQMKLQGKPNGTHESTGTKKINASARPSEHDDEMKKRRKAFYEPTESSKRRSKQQSKSNTPKK